MTKPATVVDYDAWNRGYMPPSEHVLIDKLSYRGAKVVLSTAVSMQHQIWIVIEGPLPLGQPARRKLLEIAKIWFEDEECSPATTSKATSPTTTEPATAEPTATTAAISLADSTDASVSAGGEPAARTGTPSKAPNETPSGER